MLMINEKKIHQNSGSQYFLICCNQINVVEFCQITAVTSIHIRREIKSKGVTFTNEFFKVILRTTSKGIGKSRFAIKSKTTQFFGKVPSTT